MHKALIFALFVALLPNTHNPKDEGDTYAVPLELGVAIYYEAEKYADVSPEDILTIVAGEHAWRPPYPAESIETRKVLVRGTDGVQRVEVRQVAFGLMQLSKEYLRQYNKEHGTSLTTSDLMDWRINLAVGAWQIHRIKRVHASKPRCSKQDHIWLAHWTCGGKVRHRKGCQQRKYLHRKFKRWRTFLDGWGINFVVDPGPELL